MENIGNKLDKYIKDYVSKILSECNDIPKIKDILYTDNFGEVLEKLIILHIRTWILEDTITIETKPIVIAELKKKIDICFKQKRPLFIEAINRMIDDSIINEKRLYEDSVKKYGGKKWKLNE